MDIPHLKPDSNEIRGYNAFMNAIPEEQRKRMKEIYAERGNASAIESLPEKNY